MAGTPPTITAIQDLHRRMHLRHQAATMDSQHQTSKISSTKEPTSITGPSSKARSSNASWPRTFHISMTKKKLQDEARFLQQPCIFHHQHSSSRHKIEKRGRDNRNCSTNPERRRRTNSKSTGTFSPKISGKEWQPTTTSSLSPSLQTSSARYRTSFHTRPTS